MKEMTARESFNAIMNFEKPDKLPWFEVIDPSMVLMWLSEGKLDPELIITAPGSDHMANLLILTLDFPETLAFPLDEIFGFQDGGIVVPIDKGPIPRYVIKLVADTEDYYEIRGGFGAHVRHSKHSPHSWYSMPMYPVWPVEDRKTWEEYKKRLDPKDPRRLPKDWDPDEYREIFMNYQNGPTRLVFNGFFGFGAQLMGLEAFCRKFYDDPDLVHDMADFWEYYVMEIFNPALDAFGEHIDVITWWEDYAERHGPFVSPKLYQEFFLPHYQRITDYFRSRGVVHNMVDSDGNIVPLLSLMIEAGIDGIWPLEVAAGMDVAKLREMFGEKLWFGGNIDKHEASSGKERMRKEVDRKIGLAEELGGYCPGLDHLVHVEFTFETFQEYVDYMKERLGY